MLQTGRTIVYLFDEKNGSIDAKKLTATVQSHGEWLRGTPRYKDVHSATS
jgi:hypothetical protein